MKPVARHFFIVYALLTLLDLWLALKQRNDLRRVSKPLLMPVLMAAFYFLSPVKKGRPFLLILAALFLSWCGDVLLMVKSLFIAGLISFLLAHLAYILYFKQTGENEKGVLQTRPVLALPVLVYTGVFLWVLFPHLGQLKVPVILYSLAISAMLLMAINNGGKAVSPAAAFFIFGALLFVISDSLLAIHLFVVQQPLYAPLVMATYAAAQYLLCTGALEKAKADWP